jgi:uracil phosphoribosyltransferase
MVTNLSSTNSLVSQWLYELRETSIQEDRMRFRKNIERIGEVTAYEISKRLPYKQAVAQTPMGDANCSIIATQPVIVPILRAGLPLYNGLLNFFDQADCGFIGAYRKHSIDDTTFEINQQYLTGPDVTGRPLILADSMLATGSSIKLALDTLLENDRPSQVHIVTVIACTEGVETLLRHYPEIHIWAGAIDEELTAKGYIVPGLGDAGDLCFGLKRQS